MAKFYGNIGYVETIETEPGIWEEQIKEKPYYGDVMRANSAYASSGGVNDNITVNNSISIIADPYACQNSQHMRYVCWMGNKWKINSFEINYPRLILSIGGLYEQ